MSAGGAQKTEEEQPKEKEARYRQKKKKAPRSKLHETFVRFRIGSSPLQNLSFRTSECSDLAPTPQAQSDSRAVDFLPS